MRVAQKGSRKQEQKAGRIITNDIIWAYLSYDIDLDFSLYMSQLSPSK